MVINFIGFFFSTHKSIFQTNALGSKRRNKNPRSIINFLKLYFALVFYYSISQQILTAFLFCSSRQLSFFVAFIKVSPRVCLKCYFWGRSLAMEIGLTKSFCLWCRSKRGNSANFFLNYLTNLEQLHRPFIATHLLNELAKVALSSLKWKLSEKALLDRKC